MTTADASREGPATGGWRVLHVALEETGAGCDAALTLGGAEGVTVGRGSGAAAVAALVAALRNATGWRSEIVDLRMTLTASDDDNAVRVEIAVSDGAKLGTAIGSGRHVVSAAAEALVAACNGDIAASLSPPQ